MTVDLYWQATNGPDHHSPPSPLPVPSRGRSWVGRGLRKTMIFGAVVVVAVVLALTSASSAAIRISRIRYNEPGAETGTNTHLNHEYIVVKNTGSRRVILTHWRIVEGRFGSVYSFPAFRLGAGASVTIHTGMGNDGRADLYWNHNYVWHNGRDTALLRNADGAWVDNCRYVVDPERLQWLGHKAKC